MSTRAGCHLDLDGAWPPSPLGLRDVDVRAWGPRLRCTAPRAAVERFSQAVAPRLAPFVLSGSGDFHHLTAVFLRRIGEPVVVVSFDQHPDWDVRPPRWACGGWVNRALELPAVRAVHVWGCGGAELRLPGRVFGRRAPGAVVRPWAERCPHRDAVTRAGWRAAFSAFADALAGRAVYVTVDLDVLADTEAQTNWDSGLFTAADVAWAIRALRAGGRLAGGDVCGAWSPGRYARARQRLAAAWDHPRMGPVEPAVARDRNLAAVAPIWTALTQTASDPAP